jgi:hypothetical protein
LIKWSNISLRQFCFALDHFCVILNGTRFFPFTSKLFTLFFERVHATRPLVHQFPARSFFDACMHMWRQLLHKKGQIEFPCTPVSRDVCDFLAREDNHILDIVQ